MVANLAIPLSLELSAVGFGLAKSGLAELCAFELCSIELVHVGLELEVAV
jgi:hypothetical protein